MALKPRMLRAALFLAALCASGAAFGQGAIFQSGPIVPYHSPVWYANGLQGDAGAASGFSSTGGLAAAGQSEALYVVRGTGTSPYANAGTGPNGENWCNYDAPVTNSGGYHYLCLSPNAQGGGLISYGAGGGASPGVLNFLINGVKYQYPGAGSGTVTGPGSSTSGDVACWNNTAGTLLKDCTTLPTGMAFQTPASIDLVNSTGLTASNLPADVVYTDVNQAFTKAQRFAVCTVAISTTTYTPGLDNCQNLTVNLTSACASAACTLANPSTSLVAGQSGFIKFSQPASGGPAAIGTWGSSYYFPGGTSTITFSTGANNYDVYRYDVDAASHINLSLAGLNFSH